MDVLWQINYGEMLSGLMVTTFLILLAASVAVVCLMVMLPLIDLAFKKKATPAQVETWQPGLPWLALRSDFLRPAAVPHPQLMSYSPALERAIERITPLIARSLVPKGSKGAPPSPATAPPMPLTPSRAA
jgi:hypothetical protein